MAISCEERSLIHLPTDAFVERNRMNMFLGNEIHKAPEISLDRAKILGNKWDQCPMSEEVWWSINVDFSILVRKHFLDPIHSIDVCNREQEYWMCKGRRFPSSHRSTFLYSKKISSSIVTSCVRWRKTGFLCRDIWRVYCGCCCLLFYLRRWWISQRREEKGKEKRFVFVSQVSMSSRSTHEEFYVHLHKCFKLIKVISSETFPWSWTTPSWLSTESKSPYEPLLSPPIM